jgi:hypothetical protein
MATTSVRKFALSPTSGEVLDFTEDIAYFDEHFAELGFEKTTTYTWRFADNECVLKTELQRSKDGFYLWAYVQALDEHRWRLVEVADAFGAHIVEKTARRA